MSQQGTQALQQKYNDYQQTLTDIATKMRELQRDEEEHSIVIGTLQKTPKERRCFRMVGGALVEKTAGETLPVLEVKLENIGKTVKQLAEEHGRLVEEFEKWKTDNKIQIIKQ
ncbi:CYFA0S21e01574g1_1 [Cyberlindnera fabianii]|uniref:CYFA0S21e01574g1_1 n=1 Tax=Cyberlindnera fabianii TaxID=36022 RepID=A0A061B9N4_CYBFA|nr:CYFA0S21e01574g1_1 [Cyberlindnera fabianii]